MKIMSFLLILIFLFILQAGSIFYFRFFSAFPDLILASMVSISLLEPGPLGWCLSIFCGLLRDSLSLNNFGLNAILFAVLSFLIMKLRRSFSIEDNLTRLPFILILSFLYNLTTGIITIYSGKTIAPGMFLRICIFGAVYSAVSFQVIFHFFRYYIPYVKDQDN